MKKRYCQYFEEGLDALLAFLMDAILLSIPVILFPIALLGMTLSWIGNRKNGKRKNKTSQN